MGNVNYHDRFQMDGEASNQRKLVVPESTDGAVTLKIQKEDHTYVIRYFPGQEDNVIDHIGGMGGEGRPFTFLETAKLTFEVVRRAASC
jgi:hypothetical protein